MKYFMFILSLVLFVFALICFIVSGELLLGIWTAMSILSLYLNFCALFE